MSALVDKIKSQYYEIKQQIYSENIEQEELQIRMDELEKVIVRKILNNKNFDDKDRIELLELVFEEYNKVRIIESLENDEEKIPFLGQVKDKDFNGNIIKSFKNDKNKIQFLDECKTTADKCSVLVTCKDAERLKEYLTNNIEIKKEMVKFLYTNMCYGRIDTTYWNLTKNLNLENRIIPHLLASTRYKILSKMNEEMKQDVEKYLGKPLPENIDELSEYEKVGIDIEVLKDVAITAEHQLNMDDLERKYLANCKPDKNNKKRVSIKDFIGTITPTLKYEYEGKVQTWEDLMLGLKRMPENIKNHSETYLFSDDNGEEPIRLQGIDGKYFVSSNGNHRMTMLKFRYLTEIERAKNDPQRIKEIEEEYQIQVTEAVEVPKDREEMIAINLLSEINEIQENDNQISELIENGQKIGYRIKDKENEKLIKSKDELINYLELMKQELKTQPHQYEELRKKLESYNIKKEDKDILLQMLNMEIETKQIPKSSLQTEKNIKEPQSLRELQAEKIVKEPQSLRGLQIESISNENLEKNIDIWMNRFRNKDSEIRNLPNNLKQKFIFMKSAITQAFKQAVKTRTQKDKIKSDRVGEDIDEGRI